MNMFKFWTAGWTEQHILRCHLGLRDIEIEHFSPFYNILYTERLIEKKNVLMMK